MGAVFRSARAGLVAASITVFIATCPRAALADPPAPAPASRDSIYLKNGGILRGTLVDAIPGDHARIELVTHEIERVAWADILRVEQGEAPQPATAPVVPSPAGTLPATQSLVLVHIEGANGAQLEQDTTGNDDWTAVCSAPCDKQLSTAYWYRVTGGGIRASSQFSLQGGPGARESLVVSPASKGWFIVGLVAAPIGGVVAYIGLFAGLFGSLGYASTNANGTEGHPPSPALAATGWTMVAAGGAVLVTGVVLIWWNWKTGVRKEVGATALGSGEAAGIAPPAWREATPIDRAVPRALTVPLLTRNF